MTTVPLKMVAVSVKMAAPRLFLNQNMFPSTMIVSTGGLIEEPPVLRIAGEIKSLSTDGWVAPKLSKRMDKFMLYMLIAGKKALEDGGVTEDVMDELDKEKCGVLIGSAMGGMKVPLNRLRSLPLEAVENITEASIGAPDS